MNEAASPGMANTLSSRINGVPSSLVSWGRSGSVVNRQAEEKNTRATIKAIQTAFEYLLVKLTLSSVISQLKDQKLVIR